MCAWDYSSCTGGKPPRQVQTNNDEHTYSDEGRAGLIFIITYDLRSGRDRVSLFKALQSLGPASQLMASTWAICAEESSETVAAKLLAHLDPEDSILVSQLSETDVARVTSQAAQWIAAHQQRERVRKAKQLEREREHNEKRELRHLSKSRATPIRCLAATGSVPRSADSGLDVTP